MPNEIAHSREVLVKRVRRFFEEWPDERLPLLRFLESLNGVSGVYIFGGFLREVCLYGITPFRSDIDIVVRVQNKRAFEKGLSLFNAGRNKFGGYRIRESRWLIDLWEFDRTWAFTKGVVEPIGVSSLIKTTFFDWDAAVYDFYDGKLYCENDYFSKISEKILNINLRDNPNDYGGFVRALRFIVREYAKTRTELSQFIVKYLQDTDNANILEYEANNFMVKILSHEDLNTMRERALLWRGEDYYRWISDPQLNLFEDRFLS